jgi:hypothetical protein
VRVGVLVGALVGAEVALETNVGNAVFVGRIVAIGEGVAVDVGGTAGTSVGNCWVGVVAASGEG